jgi:tetratricopeptide (TPR) repeat protein
MFGNYRICLGIIISFLLQGNLLANSSEKEVEKNSVQQNEAKQNSIHDILPKKEQIQKENLFINGFRQPFWDRIQLEGLRAKAVADLYYHKGDYTRAIQYYEDASRKLPQEADVYFNLANIYAIQDVYFMAAKYYHIAAEKYLLSENFGKTQKYYYLSRIRYAFFLEKQAKHNQDNEELAKKIFMSLLEHEQEIRENFPDILDEFEKLYKNIYGDTKVISKEHL